MHLDFLHFLPAVLAMDLLLFLKLSHYSDTLSEASSALMILDSWLKIVFAVMHLGKNKIIQQYHICHGVFHLWVVTIVRGGVGQNESNGAK